MKVLLTGFEPFLDYPINPTEEVVKAIVSEGITGLEIIPKILSVRFNHSEKELLKAIEETNPDVVVMLGLAAGRSKITPERIAINVKDGDLDNDGYAPTDESIDPAGADGIFSTLPIREMTNRLVEAGLPSVISNTAGTYLCNNIMYAALNYAQKQEVSYRAGFIHIPASYELALVNKKLPSWSLDDLVKSVRICLETL
ncbi:pyroglutamyl-peptidase I [Sporosarcina ureae]|uniref:pyroglutamyl-peptidase I n=1 Tax=Sporosarcina ureae TaxID=1571 RepID=UPI000A17FB32|nr:pyroglutamyl-peptidase I [Sporosarcina ureae]ARK22297.1 peptidase C15 [Sporosarcina ureae]